MPKLPFAEKRLAITVMIPQSLFIETKTLLLDPHTGRVKYGAMSGLITQMLTQWIEDRRKQRPTIEPDLTPDTLEEYEGE